MYVDVLVAVNLLIDYLLLLLVTKFLHMTVHRRRLLLGALVGAVGSLVILLPPFPPAVDFLVKLSLCLPVALAAFGFQGCRAFFRQVFSFFLLSFAFAGVLVAIWYFLAPSGLFVKNSVVYFDVPPLLLIGLTLLSYFVLRLLQRVTGRGPLQHTVCQLKLTLGGQTCVLQARVDTGCSLKEPFSGLPVVVAEKDALPPPPKTPARVIPFTSVGGEGLLQAWRAESCTLVFPGGGICRAACYVAYAEKKLSGGEYQALIPPYLLEGGIEKTQKSVEYGRKENGHAGKTEKMAPPLACRTGSLHQRPRNAAAAAHKGGRGKNLRGN
ncbi:MULTISPECIES: sigma-E processing peptidase SpoIIGA [Caproicibacterium]|uniref:Sigma-E processing peptidase SpoIIGA n=1 Tax=Caproicibacterium argilliputei TaxID=3030016 RepID=A0AA97H2G6_9FIRM|nr:sigma-E processing peptidase SpoIIGA [Caproicibacterium argilliputei]WOC33661.1 sigma-E processing peptidase SpoIIGA [Caproicibacterium argilliputei]